MLLVSLRGTDMWILLFQDRARLATSPCYLQSLCSAKLTANFFLKMYRSSEKCLLNCGGTVLSYEIIMWDCVLKKIHEPAVVVDICTIQR